MNENNTGDNQALPASREERIGRRAAELVKASKPQFRRLVDFTRPRAHLAGEQAVRYVSEHESELKQTAGKLARARLTGPLGLLVDSLAGSAAAAGKQALPACANCGTTNPTAAKFCNECGVRLAPEPPQG